MPAPRLLLLLPLLLLLGACAGVRVSALDSAEYMSQRRGDVLTTGRLSASVGVALQVTGIGADACEERPAQCRQALTVAEGLSDEMRLSVLAELWLHEALTLGDARHEAAVSAYLEAARHAYAYLFLTDRTLEQRALDDRQTQVRDYYNFAVQQAALLMFRHHQHAGRPPRRERSVRVGGWTVIEAFDDLPYDPNQSRPLELMAASELTFKGLRNQYRRDGLGAELVLGTARRVVDRHSAARSWSETPFIALTALVTFPGDSLEAVLSTREAVISAYDPYRYASLPLAGRVVPLAANFTSAYGVWLARSGFAAQSLLTLVGRGDVLERPQVYLLQPYDPQRRTIVMLHGLASSPEAWINVANEVMGDETLRQNYQIWQVYYPTQVPLAINHAEIRAALENTLDHLDPHRTALASRDMVLVGHSMGGVLAKLMVSRFDEEPWLRFLDQRQASARSVTRLEAMARRQLEPLEEVSRAVFIAAPHQGTPLAENFLARWLSRLVRLPVSVAVRLNEMAQLVVDPASARPVVLTQGVTSIHNLASSNPVIQLGARLPIAPHVRYHSIIGQSDPGLPLEVSSDGIVPYTSAHLPGAESERVIPAGHSVQETPEAIVELRRILRTHLAALWQ